MNKYFTIIILLAVALGLASCGEKDKAIYPFKEETKYLSVRLQGSDKWSIINVDNGDIIAKNAITGEPSAVHEDMFYVYNPETARINYYNVSDCSKPVNSKPYCSATSFNDGFAIACLPGEDLQVIDKDCNTVKKLPPSINTAGMFHNERAIVKDDRDRFGFIDTNGDIVIDAQYGIANDFLFDDAALVSESAIGDTTATSSLIVIDKDGKKLFNFNNKKYIPYGRFFCNGTLKVIDASSNSVVYLDKKGEETTDTLKLPKKIKEMNYRDVKHAGKDHYMVVKGDRVGLVDDDNETLISIDYDFITNITPKRFVVAKDSVMMIVDEKGKQIGSAKFVDFKDSNNFTELAGRGYVNPAKVAATMLQLFDKDAVFNVRKGATLMDINQIVSIRPDDYVGANELSGPLPPVIITYHFDREIASLKASSDSTSSAPMPQFNYDAAVKWVTIQFPVRECAPGVEDEILQIITQQMGKKGFGINDDGSFTSDDGCVVLMGYDKGVYILNYHFDANDLHPIPRVPRSV